MTLADKLKYVDRRHRESARQAAQAAAGQDIGDIPPVVDPKRRAACAKSLRLYAETYFPHLFHRAWSKDQLRFIAALERTILRGGKLAIVMPRGSGKTELIVVACLWAIFYGYRRFVFVGAATKGLAETIVKNKIQMRLETNDLLLADFPEIVYPVRCLGRITHRQRGQKYNGKHTYIEWLGTKTVFPTIAGSPASGSVVVAAGLDSSFKGMSHSTPDGRTLRPDMALIDDPQTRQSAASPTQTEQREALIQSDVLGLAGPTEEVAAIAAMTVVYPDDLADRFTDRARYPDWHGERMKLIYSMPVNDGLWDKYAALRRESQAVDGDGAAATDYYAARRATCGLPLDADRPCASCKRKHDCMDAGAVVSCLWRIIPKERQISPVQNAMDFALFNPEFFAAECQGSPRVHEDAGVVMEADTIAKKLSGIARGVVPLAATHVTAFIDVHKELLYWSVVAWQQDTFTGWIVDYGTFPDQERNYFTMRGCPRTLGRRFQGAGWEGAVRAGLMATADHLLGREWKREDGVPMRINLCGVDCNWPQGEDIVWDVCRHSPHAAAMRPARGKGIGASSRRMSEYSKLPGAVAGFHWRSLVDRKRRGKYTLVDTNFWKTFIHTRLGVAAGDPGCLSLFGHEPGQHRLLADHLRVERPKSVTSNDTGQTVDEWKGPPDQDNHWLDCLVGCAVAASVLGAKLAGQTDAGTGRRTRRKWTQADLTGRQSGRK